MSISFKPTLFFCIALLSLVSQAASQSSNEIDPPNDHCVPYCSYAGLLESKQSHIEIGVELLVFTSSISSIFSDAQVLLDETFGSPNSAQIFNNEVKSVDPEYNPGFSLYFKYHPSVRMNTVGIAYSYIHNNADGRLSQDNSTFIPVTNVTQTTMQRDKGSQHTHLHIVDFFVEKSIPVTSYLLVNLHAGMAFHSFHYSFNLKNDLNVTQTSNLGGAIVGIQDINATVNEKGNFWGVGPNMGLNFDFPFFSASSKHDLNFIGSTNFGLICVRDYLEGSLGVSTRLLINGQDTGTNSENITWKNPTVTHFIPNLDLDFKLQYRWHDINQSNVDLILALGYRFISYWHTDQFGRNVCLFEGDSGVSLYSYRLYPRDIEDFAYCGPYFRLGVGF